MVKNALGTKINKPKLTKRKTFGQRGEEKNVTKKLYTEKRKARKGVGGK